MDPVLPADYYHYYHLILQLLAATALGALIGLERDLSGKDPSLRTFALISLGSCIFSMISRHSAAMTPGTDPARIAAQILPGIGFIGAGAIFRSSYGVSGITTATLLWITASIGMAVGFDRVDLAFSAALMTLLAIYFLRLVHRSVASWRKRSDESRPVTQEE